MYPKGSPFCYGSIGKQPHKLLDQFTMPMLPTEPQCTNVIACI